jgi:hypothetical protein
VVSWLKKLADHKACWTALVDGKNGLVEDADKSVDVFLVLENPNPVG